MCDKWRSCNISYSIKIIHLCLIWCRIVRFRDVHVCYMAPYCTVPRCPPLRYGAALSVLALSTTAIWCRVVHSRYVSPHNFDGLAMSSSAFSVAPKIMHSMSRGRVKRRRSKRDTRNACVRKARVVDWIQCAWSFSVTFSFKSILLNSYKRISVFVVIFLYS